MERRVETFDIERFSIDHSFFFRSLALFVCAFCSGHCDVMYNDLDVGVVVYHREKKGRASLAI